MTDQPTRSAIRRMLPAILLVSLGLNLFFLGWLAGSGFRPHGLPPPPMGGPFRSLERQLAGRLSPEGMTKVGDLLHELEAGMREQFDAGDAVRRQLHSILTAETFSRDDFIRTIGVLTAGRTKFDNESAQRVADVVAKLSARDRAAFADAVLSIPPGPLG